jgi:hypothetical protein
MDLSGKRFGRLTVQQEYKRIGRRLYWDCLCDCGIRKFILGAHLTKGSSLSCGCLRNELNTERLSKEDARTKHCLYPTWSSVRHSDKGVSNEWLDFDTFILDVVSKPKDHNISRIDKNLPFSKTNFEWVPKELHNKNKRTNLMYDINGKILNQNDACKELGLTVYFFKKYVKENT